MAEVWILKHATQFPISSLKEISLFHLSATILCNNQELISLITKCVSNKNPVTRSAIKNEKAYENFEAKANELLSKISEISKIKRMIVKVLWHLTHRIIRWKSVFAPTISDAFLQYFYWTNRGRIDTIRTAQYLMENEMIPITKRFLLACSLCLSKEIEEIWKNMSNDAKREVKMVHPDSEEAYKLLFFWISELDKKVNGELGENFTDVLLCAIEVDSIAALKYLFSKIPKSAMSNKAVSCYLHIADKLKSFPYLEEEESDICYFILSQMTERELKIIFNHHLVLVLRILLHSPGQKEFLKLLESKLDALSKRDIVTVLVFIFLKLYFNFFEDYDYLQLFVSVWQMLNDAFKIYVRESLFLGICFCLLIAHNFRFLIRKRPSKKAKKPSVSAKLIRFNEDKWELLHFFIENEIVTIESLKRYRSRMLAYLRMRKSDLAGWRRLLKFVRDNKPTEK